METPTIEVWGPYGAAATGPHRMSGTIGAPLSLVVNARFNKTSTAEIVIDSTKAISAWSWSSIFDWGWVRIGLRGRTIFTGPVQSWTRTGPDGVLTLKCESFFRGIAGALVRPGKWRSTQATLEPSIRKVAYWDPDAGAAAGETWDESGPAAEVFAYANMQFEKAWHTVTPPPTWPDTDVSAKVRLKMLDTLIPLLDQFDIGVDVRPSADPREREMFFYRGGTLSRRITDTSGMLADWEVSGSRRSVTYSVVAGQGEGTERVFIENQTAANQAFPTRTPITDTKATVFVDARDAEDDATLVQRSKDAIAEGYDKASLKATLAEGKGFRFVDDFYLGDRLQFLFEGTDLPSRMIFLGERVNEVAIDWTRDQGLIITPKVGDITDSTEGRIVTAISRIGSRTTNLETR